MKFGENIQLLKLKFFFFLTKFLLVMIIKEKCNEICGTR
jgi:hypothetical protein